MIYSHRVANWKYFCLKINEPLREDLLQIWRLPESTDDENVLKGVQNMVKWGVLRYLSLLTSYHTRAARDYLVDDRVEDRGEFLVGKSNPSLENSQACIIVINRTEL